MKIDLDKAYKRMCAYAARAEHSSSDVRRKLRLLEASHEEMDAILEKLKREKFIDDERYAMTYARDKFTLNGWGPRRIASELKARSIPAAYIATALSALEDEDEDVSAIEVRLKTLLERKIASTREEDPYKHYAKVVRWALARGYEYDAIRRLYGELMSGLPEEE